MHRPVLPVLILLLVLSACDSGGPGDESGSVLVEDTVVGSGDALEDGDAVMIAYTGTLEDGSIFDVSDNQNPFAFSVGAGQVIDGLDKGLVGMRVGGTRRLTIPSRLAFGSSGVCDDATCPVPPNATVIFEVTLIRILDQPFIRDDVIVTEGWLDHLVAHLDADERVAMVGPRLPLPTGPQKTKTQYRSTKKELQKFARRLHLREEGKREEVDYLDAACVLIRTDVLSALGGGRWAAPGVRSR